MVSNQSTGWIKWKASWMFKPGAISLTSSSRKVLAEHSFGRSSEDQMNSSGNMNWGQLFSDRAQAWGLHVPASLLQLRESFFLGWVWMVEKPVSKRKKVTICAHVQSKCELKLQEFTQNYTSICWGGDAIFFPFLSTTTADRVVWPIVAPFTRKTAVSFSVDSANALQKNGQKLAWVIESS